MNPNYPQGGAIPVPNPSYPMARLNGSAYAAPLNYNQPSEVVGGYDAKINPMTGEEIPDVNFAKGGEVGLASLLASRGRGGDSMLVHMNPEEVKGLQALALAHGGSLTVNPDTGLVEALSLKSILPTIAGAVLNRFVPNLGKAVGTTLGFSEATAGNVGAGLIVGGITGLVEGDLKKGLQAGLGAYSGATLSSGLSAAQKAAEEAKVGNLTQPSTLAQQFGLKESEIMSPVSSMRESMEKAVPGGLGVDVVDTVTAPLPAVGVAPAAPPVEIKPSIMGGIRGLFTPEGQKAFGTALGGGFESPFAQNLSRYATFAGAMLPFTEQPKPFPTGGTGQDIVYIPGGRNPQYGTGRDQPYYLQGQYYRRTDKGLVPVSPFAKGFADGGMVDDRVGMIGPIGGDMAVVGGSPGFAPAFATQAAAPVSPFQGPVNVPAYATPTTDPNVLATRAYIEELNRRVRAPYVAPGAAGEAGRGLSSFGGMGLPIDTGGAGGGAGGGGGGAPGVGSIVGGIAANYLVNKGLDAGLGYLQNKLTGKAVDATGAIPGAVEPSAAASTAPSTVAPSAAAGSFGGFDPSAGSIGQFLANPSLAASLPGGLTTLGSLGGLSSTGFGAVIPASITPTGITGLTSLSSGLAPSGSIASTAGGGMSGALGTTGGATSGIGAQLAAAAPYAALAAGVPLAYEGISKSKEGQAALGGALTGAGGAALAGVGGFGSMAGLAALGPAALIGAGIAALGSSLVNTKEQGDVALRNYWKAVDEGRGLGQAPPQELAEGFINFYRTNKNEFPGQAKYGRKGNEDFVYDMTQVINDAVKSGAVPKDADASTLYSQVVQPWLSTMGEGPKDPDARRVQDFMMTDLIYNFMQGNPISNAQVKGDKKFKIVSERPVYAGAVVQGPAESEAYTYRKGMPPRFTSPFNYEAFRAEAAPAPQSSFAAPEERATIMPVGQDVPITPYGPLEAAPGPGLAGDDGRVITQPFGEAVPITPEAPVQEFVGTPYMPQPEIRPVSPYEAPVYVPREESVPISPVVQEPAAADFIRRSLAANREYVQPEPSYNPYTDFSAEPMFEFAAGGAIGNDYNFGFAQGGRPMEYMAGGKFLQGPGDGMSDDIKANIDGKQEARLADGEFVIPADVVSHLGNGSSNAGAKKLHQMMARVRQARTGKKKQAPAVKMNRYLPA